MNGIWEKFFYGAFGFAAIVTAISLTVIMCTLVYREIILTKNMAAANGVAYTCAPEKRP